MKCNLKKFILFMMITSNMGVLLCASGKEKNDTIASTRSTTSGIMLQNLSYENVSHNRNQKEVYKEQYDRAVQEGLNLEAYHRAIVEQAYQLTNALKSTRVNTTGWQQLNGKWYFFKSDGSKTIGWINVNEKWYYLYDDGSMASNTIIDGYKLDKNGAWVKTE